MKTNRKQARGLLLSFFAMLMPFLASAQVEIDGIWYKLVSKAKVAEVTSNPDAGEYQGSYSGSITIPSTVTYEDVEYNVTSIESRTFGYCSKLTTVNIPESVTNIGGSAFLNCSSLTSITIPEGVAKIESVTFSGCSNLTSITIPKGVTSIGNYAFYDCSSLASITIPNGVTSIGDYVFDGCSSLTSINIPEGVTSIGRSAFQGCNNLISIVIPEGVTTIDDYAFDACSSLTSITLPESATSIGRFVFSRCSSLASITLPEGMTRIGEGLFKECSSLTDITIPKSATNIGSSAFYGCSSLTAIIIPEGVMTIYTKAFANCSELIDVYCFAETVPTTDADVFDGSYPEYATLHVPAIALESYQSTAPWSSFGTIVAIEGDQPAEEEWSEWTTLGTAVTTSGKDAMMTNLRYWGEGTIEEWNEPITIDQRTNKADPTKHQLRLNGIFNAKDVILDYDSSTTTITAQKQSTGYATNKTMIEEQGVPDPYEEFIFSLGTGTYFSATGVIDMSSAFFYVSDGFGFNMGFSLQIEGVTPPTFTAVWDKNYIGRKGGEATLTVNFEEPIVKYRKLILAPGKSINVSDVTALYTANPVTKLDYEETDQATTSITCTEMGTYRVVLIPIGADGTALLKYQLYSIVSYAEPGYDTYEWEYLGESTVTEHVGSLLIPNEERWEEVEGTWVDKYPHMTTCEGVKTYRRSDNPNIIGLCNLYGENHPYSSMFTYIDQTQDWWIYIDITNAEDVKLLTTPVGVSSSQAGYGCFINQYATTKAATYADGVITFPKGTVLIGNFYSQDEESAFDFKINLPVKEEPILQKCATPTISYIDGKVALTCETEDAKVITTVTNGNDETHETLEFTLIPTYTLTAYATKEQYENSDIVTATICWVECTGVHEDDDTDGILTIPSMPVLIQSADGAITLSGLINGTEVTVFDTTGRQIGTAVVAAAGTATINTGLAAGSTAIVKVGTHGIKVVIK